MKTRAPEPGNRDRRGAARRGEGGFTLIEVMLALAILGTAAVVILDQRVGIVREASAARDARTTWMLASRKIAELEQDKELWRGTGGSSNGNFSELHADYAEFTWEYLAAREPVETQDPALVKPGEKPKEIFRVALAVRAPGTELPVVIEAMFPVQDIETAGEPAPESPSTPPTPPPPSFGEGGKKP